MKKQFTSAFSLVELTVALGIAAFCLIAVFGIMPVGVQTNRNATSETAATNIMAAVVSDLRATPRCLPTSSIYQITLGTVCTPVSTPSPTTLYFDGTGQFSTLLGSNSRYQLNVTWSQTGGGVTALRSAYVKVTWPAAATPANASGSTEMFVAFDRD
jgi:uncharacterized protein (TIGR02598 family)